MKIQADILRKFIQKTSLNGLIEGSVIEFTDNGIKIWNRNVQGSVAIFGLLKKECIKDYEVKSNIGIKSNSVLLKLLKRFVGEIEFVSINNVLTIVNEKKKVEIVEGNENYIDSKITQEINLEYSNAPLNISVDIFTNSVNNMSDLEAMHLKIIINNKVMELIAGEEGFNKVSERHNIEYDNMNVMVGTVFKDVVTQLDNNIWASFKDNCPIQIVEGNDNYNVKYIIAPLME